MNHDLIIFLQGISSTAAWVNGLFFFRFWRESRDELFAFFGAAFGLLGLSWALLAVFAPTEETRPYIYGLRLIAFLLIIAGIAAKNRRHDQQHRSVTE
jgi:hypothetical protein